MSLKLRNQAPLFTELRLLQATLIMLMLFLEQARGRHTWSLRVTGRPRVGDPWATGTPMDLDI